MGHETQGRGSGRKARFKGPTLHGHCLALPRDAGAKRASPPLGTLDPGLQHRHPGRRGRFRRFLVSLMTKSKSRIAAYDWSRPVTCLLAPVLAQGLL